MAMARKFLVTFTLLGMSSVMALPREAQKGGPFVLREEFEQMRGEMRMLRAEVQRLKSEKSGPRVEQEDSRIETRREVANGSVKQSAQHVHANIAQESAADHNVSECITQAQLERTGTKLMVQLAMTAGKVDVQGETEGVQGARTPWASS
jgi:hypothetical protein